MRPFRILIFEGYALSTKVHRRSLNRLKCTPRDRATILVSSLYNSLVFRLKRLFFFEVDVEVNQDIPIGTTFAMSLECDWTEDTSYSESKPKPGQLLEVARMFICSPDRSDFIKLLDRFRYNARKYGVFTSLEEMIDEKAKKKFEKVALLHKDPDDLKYTYCLNSYRMMITPNNEMAMVNVLTDKKGKVISTVEQTLIVGTNAMFICLLSMLKDDVVLEAEVIKVSEYLNI